jgi:molybdopterin converting factor subunit 1
MQVSVLFFGITKDLIGKRNIFLELPGIITVAEFKRMLQERHPELLDISSLAIAVNSTYAFDADLIQANDEIALIPPVSGG